MQTRCCVCNKVKTASGQWVHGTIDLEELCSHGYCDVCLIQSLEDFGLHDLADVFKRKYGPGAVD